MKFSPIPYARISVGTVAPQTFNLRITRETEHRLSGIEVDAEGDAVVKNMGGKIVDETQHIIDKPCITKRVDLRMNLTFAKLEPVRKVKARIRQNVWGNWYGYLGTRRVIAFGNGPEATAEQAANTWLQENS